MRVEEGNEEGDESEGKADDEGCVGGLMQSGRDDQGAGFTWWEAWAEEGGGESDGDEHDEGHGADGPGEADGDDQAPDYEGVDYTA